MSFSNLIFGLLANVLDIGFHSYNFLTTPIFCRSVYTAKSAQRLGLTIINYILISNYVN